jgi:hypothetical protein
VPFDLLENAHRAAQCPVCVEIYNVYFKPPKVETFATCTLKRN